MDEKNVNCIYCGNPLSGKQTKYCSKKCMNKDYQKKKRRKKWKVINAKTKTRKIAKKTRRKVLIEQEIKRRKELI